MKFTSRKYHSTFVSKFLERFLESWEDKFQMWLSVLTGTYNGKTANAVVILSGQSESKDLGTEFTANEDQMRRFLDAAYASLGMTCLFFARFAILLTKADNHNSELSVRWYIQFAK